jgi:hypothetical protein
MSDELRPCPFCGCKPYVGYDGTSWRVGCRSGVCLIMPELSMWKKSDAISYWNTRTPAPDRAAGSVENTEVER